MKKQDEGQEALGILMADSHLRDKAPARRTDNFYEKMVLKMLFVLDLQRKLRCPVYHAGDFLDDWTVSHRLVSDLILLLKDKVAPWYVVPGQHDLRYHNLKLLHETALHVLHRAGAITILPAWSDESRDIGERQTSRQNVAAFPWGIPIPTDRPWDKYFGQGNDYPKLAILHRLTWAGKRPFPAAADFATVESLHEQLGNDFDLVLTGDCHVPFTAVKDKTIIHNNSFSHQTLYVNPGPLMRCSVDEGDHKPSVYVWRKGGRIRVEQVVVPHDEGVFEPTDEQIGKLASTDSAVLALLRKLRKATNGQTYDFYSNMTKYLNQNPTARSVRALIEECMRSDDHVQ